LLATLDAMHKKDMADKKFLASLQGIDLDESVSQDTDITNLKGVHAQQDGFGIGLGLGHMVEDNT
jgi:hypothetical protein